MLRHESSASIHIFSDPIVNGRMLSFESYDVKKMLPVNYYKTLQHSRPQYTGEIGKFMCYYGRHKWVRKISGLSADRKKLRQQANIYP
jgi:hypothetical protein